MWANFTGERLFETLFCVVVVVVVVVVVAIVVVPVRAGQPG